VRPLVLVIGVLVVAAVVAERVAPRVAERRVADALVTRFSLSQRPRVDLGGFPFLLRAASGQLDHVNVSLSDYVTQGLRFADIELHVGRITYPPTAPLRGGTASASAITGTARVTQADLATYLLSVGSSLVVRLSAGRVTVIDHVTVAGIAADVSATGVLSVAGQSLTFRPDVVSLGPLASALADAAGIRSRLSFTAPLPDIVGIHVQSLTIVDGAAMAQASVDDMTFSL